ncbi:MAG: sigma-54 dependent transcriptional regulator [Spirochaetales bacterium]|uniref:Sigma-54 dependent transcriptional regulator n=1 Tax=Candidatus Thalassospirochaeta sargassi TaxID=3119039 RepID=A0AAJ1IGZ2_9SPIO|nr:sigma-54 dependent transcriptional regulator [Spirochaetales bacterium]
MKYNILIVDDIEKLCKIIVQDLELLGYRGMYATNSSTALEIFSSENIHVVLLDLKLGKEDGIEVLGKMKKLKPNVPVFMITGHGSISNAVTAIKSGAYDYIQKPVDFERLKISIQNAIDHTCLKDENLQLKKLLEEKRGIPIVTIDPQMQALLERLKKFAATDYPIFIEGESGSGKELIAEYIHLNSVRKENELFKINCAAFSETLLDDELFGHYKGAFTGADADFKGVFERANNSTLFLDEIGDMTPTIQAKILRTLQNKEVRRLGGKKNILVDVRFIAATNKNIKALTEQGSFREDLYFRLNTVMVSIPPLRKRPGDIKLLCSHFLKKSSMQSGSDEKEVAAEVEEFFSRYPWPGNIRELQNVINYCNTVNNSGMINMSDLPNYLINTPQEPFISKEQRLTDESKIILDALAACNYNKSRAAEYLKISRKTLYNKMEKYEINV